MHAFQIRVLLSCLGVIAYTFLDTRAPSSARICFALQAMLFSAAASEGVIAVRHPSLYSLPSRAIWRCFTEPRSSCVYIVASAFYSAEYIGSTCDWQARLYSHARHVLLPRVKGQQPFHSYIRRFASEFVFLPVSLTGSWYLEHRLIRTFSPALNVYGFAPSPFAPAAVPVPTSSRVHRRPGHVRRPVSHDPAVTTYTIIPCGKSYLLLFDALCDIAQSGGAALLRVSAGTQWLDSSKVLLRGFGACVVDCIPLSLVDAPLSAVWQDLKRLCVSRGFIMGVSAIKQAHPFLLAHFLLVSLLADGSRVRLLYQMPEHSLVTLMRAALQFTPVRSRATLCAMVNAVYSSRFRRSLLFTPVVRVPFGLHQFAGPVSAACREVLGKLSLSPPYAAWLQSRLRVVCQRGVSVAKLLHTHRLTAVSATLDDFVSAVDDGVFLRCSDLASHPTLYPLNIHSGVCPPNSFKFAISAVSEQISSMCASLVGTVPPPATERIHALLRRAAGALAASRLDLAARFAACAVPPLSWWLRLRRALHTCNLVCMPLDRDPHRLVICSRANFLVRLRTLFLEDHKHYAVCPALTPASLLAGWKSLHNDCRWARFGPLAPRSAPGYGYCFPKAKDVARSRVIVSCVAHPLRRILHLVGRVLIQLLCRCAFPHYNLYSVAQFAQRLEFFASTLSPSAQLLAVCTDVKEMYTGMDHAATVSAVAFVLDSCKQHMRSPYVSIATTPHGDFHVGRSRARKQYVTFHMDDLLQFVRFELSNLYFQLGKDVVLHQKVGAAMGGFTSPGCAQCVAAVAEYVCMRRFLASARIFAGRFMDDTLTLINLHRCSASDLRSILTGCFFMYGPAGLQVELEAAGLTATMLSSRVSVACGVQCVFWNKNARFAATGEQCVRRILPCIAQTPAAQRAIASGTVHRMAAATISSSVPLLLEPLLQLRFEFAALGYAPRAFDLATRAFVYARRLEPQSSVWRSLLTKFHRATAADFKPP